MYTKITRAARVFYLGMVVTDAYGTAVGEKTYAGAASQKMLLVARAMRRLHLKAVIVSLPFVGTRATRAAYRTILTVETGVPAIFLAVPRSKYLRKLLGPFILAVFVWRKVRSGDTVIVYNHAVEYCLALLILRARRIRTLQDIEDAPTEVEPGMRGWLNRVFFKVTASLTTPRKMVVANHVAKALGLKDYVVVRGAATPLFDASRSLRDQKWLDLEGGRALRIHYGGTLIRETGVDLFCGAVELIAAAKGPAPRVIVFIVSGTGELDKLRDLAERLNHNERVRVILQPELCQEEYVATLRSCHASLSLKRPDGAMASTTFPSKVIEITAAGLALVSTRLGDLAEIFDDDSALFLSAYQAEDLAEAIVNLAADPSLVRRLGEAGRQICERSFSLDTVGNQMKMLLESHD